ncbi:helix-turn-helix domain-containing protein [Lancefieldella parvula]|uniref:helix-turn-helix domain-containing protein n=1 Tax=Lancefieldella parvula TaxID=1382 RepID=UPI00288A6FA8|nr:helix-turn-helix transcriptional regulator [Lancefieldella parvula]
MTSINLAENIRVNRARKRLTQKDLADRSGVAIATIGKLERGIQSEEETELRTVIKLATALDISPNKLVGW